ncbi:MAG: helix-turn-helix domain-containing protein [Firmicutes bacterium]|nr:helix-turn-helix domain-containing protein [Bacillota bacterium]
MQRSGLTRDLSSKIRLIRAEMNYTQDRMAEVLGISKKTLVEIEKGRKDASWAVVVTACALFPESEVIQSMLGEDPLSILQVLSRQSLSRPRSRTLGGRVWWAPLEQKNGFRLQRNIISGHYRILDAANYLWFSSFDREEALKRLSELARDIQ